MFIAGFAVNKEEAVLCSSDCLGQSKADVDVPDVSKSCWYFDLLFGSSGIVHGCCLTGDDFWTVIVLNLKCSFFDNGWEDLDEPVYVQISN